MGVVYSGIVGQYLLPPIRGATRSLDIVSPYLSPEYAQLLSSKAKQGVIVRLITSDSNGQRHQQALRMLKQPTSGYVLHSRFWRYIILAILFGMSGAMLWGYGGLVLLAVCLVALVAGLVKNLTRQQVSTTPLFVKVLSATQLVHVKLYVVDQQMAFTGSANLTYSGMNRNIERIEMKTMPSEVQTEMAVFSSIWGPTPVPVIPPARTPVLVSSPQPRDASDTGVMPREEAETLERLYKNFQSAPSTKFGKVSLTPPGTGVRKLASTWKERLWSRMRRLFL